MADMTFTAGLDDKQVRRALRNMERDSVRSGRKIERAFWSVGKRFLGVAAAVRVANASMREFTVESGKSAAIAERFGKASRDVLRYLNMPIEKGGEAIIRATGGGEELDQRAAEIAQSQTLPEDAAKKRFDRMLQRGAIDIFEGTGRDLEARRRALILEYDEMIDQLESDPLLSRADRDRFRRLLTTQRDTRLGLIRADAPEGARGSLAAPTGLTTSQVRGALGTSPDAPRVMKSDAELRREEAQRKRQEDAKEWNATRKEIQDIRAELQRIDRAKEEGHRANWF